MKEGRKEVKEMNIFLYYSVIQDRRKEGMKEGSEGNE